MASRVTFSTGPLVGKVRAAVNTALFAAGNAIEIEAERSIVNGGISGAGHVPSAPGQPPNADTRQLDSSINTLVKADLAVDVVASAPYAAALELGTERMEPRPFMRPALEAKTPEAQALVARAVRKATT